MAVTHTLQASFTQSIGKAIVMPPNSKTMVFFGTGGDGNEANRVSGGPALSVTSGTPVHAANYVSVGHQPAGAPTRYDTIDTTVANDSTNFPLGYTWAAVARTTGEGTNYNEVVGSMTAASGQIASADALGMQQSNNRVINGGGMSNRGFVQLNNPVASNWHFVALTSTGGATPVIIAYEFTEVPAGQASATYSPTGRTALPACTAHFGSMSVETSTFIGPMDIAWGFVCTGAMSQVNLAALAASVRPWLARRGIVA
jgi:hypothetical protein